MFNPELFLPVLAHFVLMFVLGLATASLRVHAGFTGQLKGRAVALGERNWPTHVQKVSNAFNNQFETPTLLYSGVAFAMIAGVSSPLMVALAWVYVATRAVHALIYVTSNVVLIRFAVFIVGYVALAVFWALLAKAAL